MIEQIEQQPDNPFPETPQRDGQRLTLLLFLGVLAVAALAYLFLSTQAEGTRGLKPPRNTATPLAVVFDSQPVIVTFSQLNEDPAALLNRTIRVTGNYTPLTIPKCRDQYTGPRIAWALIAEELQLDALGFEEVLRLVPAGTNMTIEGVWRLYQGPYGCGKEPATSTVWYLEVSRIVQPNPLPNFDGTAVVSTPAVDPEAPAAETPTPTAAGTQLAVTPIATATGGQPTEGVPTHTPIPTTTVVGEPTVPIDGTVTPTPFVSPTATPTADLAASPTPTPLGSTAAPTATPPVDDNPTATPAAPLATATPNGSGYPDPPPTATSSSSYPTD